MALTIRDRSRDGLLEITDVSWEGSREVLRVTVRELIGRGANGSGWIGGTPWERMRKLAKRAAPFPVRESHIVSRFVDGECDAVTFRLIAPVRVLADRPESINSAIEFDQVFRVTENGLVIDEPNVYAPSSYDGSLDASGWSYWSTGYSGQDRYTGPIMHASEQLAGGIARDLLAQPGVYALVVDYSLDEEDGDDNATGWAVVRKDDAPKPARWDGSAASVKAFTSGLSSWNPGGK